MTVAPTAPTHPAPRQVTAGGVALWLAARGIVPEVRRPFRGEPLGLAPAAAGAPPNTAVAG